MVETGCGGHGFPEVPLTGVSLAGQMKGAYSRLREPFIQILWIVRARLSQCETVEAWGGHR